MAKDDDLAEQLNRAREERELNDDVLSRVQAIEDILVNECGISKRLLRQRQKTIREKLSEKRRADDAIYLKKVFAEIHKRRRKLLDKASGPVQ